MLTLEGKIGEVIRGKNGRLFLGNQEQFDAARFMNRNAFSGSVSRVWRRTVEQRAKMLAERSIPYVFYICPDAHSVFPEDLPAAFIDDFVPPGEQFERDMQGIPNLQVVYPRQQLLSAKGGLELYQKNDTHWTGYGSYVAYAVLCDHLSGIVPFTRIRARDVDFKLTRRFGDLGILVDPEESAESAVATVGQDPPDFLEWNEGVGRVNVVETRSRTVKTGRAMFFRDSFMTALADYVTRSFANVLMAGTTARVHLEEIDRWKPDVVVSQMAERRLFAYQPDHQLELFDDIFRCDYQSSRGKRALQAMLNLVRGNPAEALSHLAGFDTELDSLSPDHCFVAARVCLANGRAHSADVYIQQAIALRPDRGSYCCFGAQIKLALGNGEEAAALARRAVDAAPHNGYYHEVLGYVLLQVGRTREAGATLNSAVQLVADCSNLWYWTSVARQGLHDDRGALEAAEQAVYLNPENPVYAGRLDLLKPPRDL